MKPGTLSLFALAGLGGVAAAIGIAPAPPADPVGLSDVHFEPPSGVRAEACFAADADPRLVARIQQTLFQMWDYDPEFDHRAEFRWPNAPNGFPVHLTWSIPPDGLHIPSGIGEQAGPNTINNMLAQIFGTTEAGKDRIRLTFARWEQMTGVTYTEVSDDGAAWGANGPFHGQQGRGDIRIVAKTFGFTGVLAYNFFPPPSQLSGDMVLNRNHQSDFAFASGNYRVLRNVVAHEHGHGLGIAHVCPMSQTKLMEPAISLQFDMLQHDDVRGGQFLYGDRFERNDSSATATPLGSVSSVVQVFDIGLHHTADSDFFAFTVDPGKQVTITATPVGFTYQDWNQLSNGACATSGPITNSLAIQNLALTLFDTNGSTQLIFSDNSPIGQPEVISDFVLPSGGTFFVRVGGTGTNNTQLYNLRIDVETSQTAEVTLADLSIIFGQYVEGTLDDLRESNDTWHVVNSVFGFSATEPNIAQIVVGAQSTTTSVSDMEVLLEGRLDNPGGAGTFQLFRWGTSAYETVHQYSIGQTEQQFMFDVNSPNIYIRASDGRIQAQIKHTVVATFSASGFRQFLDHLRFDVTP